MKTVKFKSKTEKISYRTNTEMLTRLSNKKIKGGKCGQFGADIYNFDNNDTHVVLVATAQNGADITATTTIITKKEYEKYADLYDCYNAYDYHIAIMYRLGFNVGIS